MWLPDAALDHLREVAELPDFSATKYEIRSLLGRGGMGSVYLALDTELQRDLALKVLSDPNPDPAALARLQREARILARLEHPGIVPVHDVGILADGRMFYAMKRVDGDRLDAYLSSRDLSLPQRLRIFERICEAVAFAHSQGVIHRDLKPANVMVGAFGEVLVMDWGVAKLRPSSASSLPLERAPEAPGESAEAALPDRSSDGVPETAHGTILGTPGYMAPEQERGEVEAMDERTDVFALGGLLDFLLGGEDASPVALRAVIRKARARKPLERYAGAAEMAEEVGRYLSGLAVVAHRESPYQWLVRFYGRYRAAILLVLAYLLMRVLAYWGFGF